MTEDENKNSGKSIESECVELLKNKANEDEDKGHKDRRWSRIVGARESIESLESSLELSRILESEQSSRYSKLKTRYANLSSQLRDADKRNKNMLNLFRRSVTHYGFENFDHLPWNLRIQVQRTWHQKYDAMLRLTERLKHQVSSRDEALRETEKRLDALEKRLLIVAENLIRKEEALGNICRKYLALKKRKDEQEILLRGSIETLQDALQRASCDATPPKSVMTLIPSKDALLARQTRRSDRLARENFILRGLVREARNGRAIESGPSSPDCSSISLVEKMT